MKRRIDYVENGYRLPYKMALREIKAFLQEVNLADKTGGHKELVDSLWWDLIEVLREEMPSRIRLVASRRLR